LSIPLLNVNRCKKNFSATFCGQIGIKYLLNSSPHFKHVATVAVWSINARKTNNNRIQACWWTMYVLVSWLWFIQRVSKEKSQHCFWHNFVKFLPTLIIFGVKMAKTILLWMVHCFTTSPNLCQCTTVWNTDASNCYITWLLFVSDGSPLHHQFDRDCNVV